MDAQVALGRIAEVIPISGPNAVAVFLLVDLIHQTEGAEGQTQARVRLLQTYAGPGFGDYWVPEAGQIVLCFFPGMGGEGSVGGDIDEGYALGVVPGDPAPPQAGQAGPLSTSRRVFKGRPGAAYDRLVQGNVDGEVTGAEVQANGSTFSRTIVGIAEWLGDAAMRMISQATLTLSGVDLVELISETLITITAPAVEVEASSSATITTPSLSASVTNGGTGTLSAPGGSLALAAAAGAIGLEAAEVTVDSPDVRLGDGTLRRLIDERLVAIFNGHSHPGANLTPNSPIAIDDCGTVATEAS